MKSAPSSLTLISQLPIRAREAGLFICPGTGRHQEFNLETFELILVRNGVLRMYEAERQFTLERGQTLLLWPHRRHGGVGAYDPDTQFYWLHFNLNARRAGNKSTLPQTGTPRRPELLFELFHRYLHDFQGSLSPGFAADLLACEILLEAGHTVDPDASRKDDSLAAKAKTYIDAEFHRNLSPSTIAAALGYSLDYLGEKFQKAQDQTLGQYLCERRIKEARLVLRERPLRIKEIALLCGFTSEQYFCRVFKKHEGISPSDYRALHARTSINIR